MLYALLKALHLLAVVLWVGGMAFVLLFLRPALTTLQPPERLRLMREVLRRFFSAVTWAVVLVLGSGLWMIGRTARALVQAGAAFTWPLDWVLMTALGVAMTVIFAVIRMALWPRFVRALEAAGATPGAGLAEAAAALARIRLWVAVNLALGVTVILVAVLI
jgi:uncharacterized membrane protein